MLSPGGGSTSAEGTELGEGQRRDKPNAKQAPPDPRAEAQRPEEARDKEGGRKGAGTKTT